MLRSSHALLASLAVALPTTISAATQQSFKGEYTVSVHGFSVAKASFSSSYEGDTYSIEGSVSSAGLATIFDDTRGTVSSKGKILGKQLQPQAFRADYKSGDKASMIDIQFANGTVIATKVVPAPKKRNSKKWIPLAASHLASVLDPMAATVIHADSLDKVCGRTVKLYDGEMRADLRLTYESKGSTSVRGYEGDTVTCRLDFEPVAGYRKNRKSLDYLRKRSRIMVTFAPVGQTGVYAPIHATVGTKIGTLTVSAERFEATE
jgi:hypothetical protein